MTGASKGIGLAAARGTSDDEFEWGMRMNCFTALWATRAALVPMVEQGTGAVVNVASVNAFFQPGAGAAKAALVNLSKSLAQEHGVAEMVAEATVGGPAR